MRIGIDIDGVLTNIEQWQLDYLSKYYYEKLNKIIVNSKAYDTDDMFGVSAEIDKKIWNNAIWRYIKEPARPFANEIIKKFKEDEHEIYIITARSSDLSYVDNINTEQMQNYVKLWLKENDIYYDKIIFSPEDKLQICIDNKIDIMIEDKPANIEKISTKIPVIAYNANYNKECQGDNIIRCYSWYDIYAKISRR